MQLEFFGAAGEVTGSCHILRVGARTVLLDCGLIQGGRSDEARNADPFPFDARRIDRSQDENWSKAVFEASGRRGADVVVDNVIGGTLPLSLRAAARRGRVLTVGNTGGPKVEIDNRFVFGKHLSILGSTMGTRADFAAVMALVFAGELKPVLDRSYPLAEARRAQERLEAGDQMGKITLAIP